jgi:hypothetical protein
MFSICFQCHLQTIGPQYPQCLTLVAKELGLLRLLQAPNSPYDLEQPRYSWGIIGATKHVQKMVDLGVPQAHPIIPLEWLMQMIG